MPELSSLTIMLVVNVVLPWIGIYMMEEGAPGLNISQIGSPNGATLAYGGYVLVGTLVYLLLYTHWQRPSAPHRVVPITQRAMHRVTSVVIAVELGALIFVYLGAGASAVLEGDIGKGEFRSNLGALGPLAYSLRDFLGPMLCALVGWVWRRCPAGTTEHALFGVTILLTSSYSAVWGYKTAALQALVPTVLVVLPTMKLSSLLLMAIPALLAPLGFAMLFDRLPLAEAFDFVLWRATVGSGDTLWRLWDLQSQGYTFAPYLPTLWQILGSTLGVLVSDLSRTNQEQLLQTDFSVLATTTVKDYVLDIQVLTSNVTSTVFGEGLIALGSPGYLVFAALAGVVVALTRTVLNRAVATERPLLTIGMANYIGFSVIAWLSSGGLIALCNIPHLVSFTFALTCCALILGHAGLGRLRVR